MQAHTAVAVLGITSLSAREAAPMHLATYVRGHWSRENKIHWVRDVTFREDASQINTGSRLRVMATLRNLVVGLIRQAGYTKIAATVRRITSRPAGDDESTRLQLRPGSPVLAVTRTAYDTHGTPVETNDMLLVADRYELIYRSWRRAGR